MNKLFSNKKVASIVLTITGLLSALVTPVAFAASLQAYGFTVAGQSSCGTWGPTDHMRYDYPGGFSGKYVVGTPGPGCNVQQSSQYFSGASGPLSATSSASSNAMGPGLNSSYSGNSQASAAYGKLGVAASGTYNGSSDTYATRGAESFATFTESFTIAGTSGEVGYFSPTFSVDGDWGKTGSAAVQFQLDYKVNTGPMYLLYRIQGDITQSPSLWHNGYVNSMPGLTVGPNSVTGSTQVSIAPILFQYNQAFDLTIGLYASVIPYSGSPSIGTADFLHTAELTGISILNSAGQALPDFSISSASGTLYDAMGVRVVPVPAALWLFVSGLLGLMSAVRLKQR